MPDFPSILFFGPSVMFTGDSKKWQIFGPICILIIFDHMWVGAHITSRDRKVIKANISSTDNQRIKNIFVIIVNMWNKIQQSLIIEVTGFHTLWKFVLNDLVHFKVWYKHQWSSKLNRGCFKDAQKDWWNFLKINAP